MCDRSYSQAPGLLTTENKALLFLEAERRRLDAAFEFTWLRTTVLLCVGDCLPKTGVTGILLCQLFVNAILA